MSLASFAVVELQPAPPEVDLTPRRPLNLDANDMFENPEPLLDEHVLRACAWEISERRRDYCAGVNHVGLAMVSPGQGFIYWRMMPEWIDKIAGQKGGNWNNCRMIVRLYDVSYIDFNGLNAHHIEDHTLPAISGEYFFGLRRPGTWQLAEVGFLLRNGEFIPAARSQTVRFPRINPAGGGETSALLVTRDGRKEDIGNVWEQDRILRERRQPKLKHPLRIALVHCGAAVQENGERPFITQLAEAQAKLGHEIHLFVPAANNTKCELLGVRVHMMPVASSGNPIEQSRHFGQAVSKRLAETPRMDLLHMHEWMGAGATTAYEAPRLISLTSVETTRRNGTPPSALSKEIEETERAAIRTASAVLAPDWLRGKAAQHAGMDANRICGFPMHGRVCNEWDGPLDLGQVKSSIHVGPVDRMILFVGSLDHGAGCDLLVEAMPTLLHRAGNLRLVYAGNGGMYGHLQHRANQLGVAHAVRLLGHVDQPFLTKLLRAADALILPSRYRVPFDDNVVDLARRAGRPVVTTHAGPAHLVRHEENGLITYDNPGSMVWAIDRILSDPGHADRMGQNGRRNSDGAVLNWHEVANRYFEICASFFPTLTLEAKL